MRFASLAHPRPPRDMQRRSESRQPPAQVALLHNPLLSASGLSGITGRRMCKRHGDGASRDGRDSRRTEQTIHISWSVTSHPSYLDAYVIIYALDHLPSFHSGALKYS